MKRQTIRFKCDGCKRRCKTKIKLRECDPAPFVCPYHTGKEAWKKYEKEKIICML
jgi:hypothetical protein